MIHFENIINAIRDNNGFKSNKHEDSYYRLYNTSKGPIQVRISNHGTELWTWVKNAPIDPSECYANICIVLSDDGTHHSNTTADMNIYQKDENGKNILDYDGKRIPVGRLDDFEVIQYVYNLSILSNRNVGIINKMIQQIPTKSYYYEPLQTNPQKHAKVFKLIPNKPEEILKENIDTNMKTENRNVVRLTESQLKQIVAEELKKALMKEVESYSAEEMRDKWKKDGNLYNDAYPTSNGDDLYTLGSYNNKVEPIYFSNKADAMDWIKTYVTDPQSIQALKDALSQYRLHDPNSDSLGKRRINQVSSNLDTHRRRQSF